MSREHHKIVVLNRGPGCLTIVAAIIAAVLILALAPVCGAGGCLSWLLYESGKHPAERSGEGVQVRQTEPDSLARPYVNTSPSRTPPKHRSRTDQVSQTGPDNSVDKRPTTQSLSTALLEKIASLDVTTESDPAIGAVFYQPAVDMSKLVHLTDSKSLVTALIPYISVTDADDIHMHITVHCSGEDALFLRSILVMADKKRDRLDLTSPVQRNVSADGTVSESTDISVAESVVHKIAHSRECYITFFGSSNRESWKLTAEQRSSFQDISLCLELLKRAKQLRLSPFKDIPRKIKTVRADRARRKREREQKRKDALERRRRAEAEAEYKTRLASISAKIERADMPSSKSAWFKIITTNENDSVVRAVIVEAMGKLKSGRRVTKRITFARIRANGTAVRTFKWKHVKGVHCRVIEMKQ